MVLLECRYSHDSVAFVVSLLVCALSRVTLSEFLAVNQELILLAATVVLLLLCPVELIVFAVTVLLLFLVVFLELVDFAATAMLHLLVGLELISAFAATMTLVLFLRLLGYEVNVRWRRQVVVWIWLSLISLRAFSLDNSCMGIHANSGGANAHGNSRVERGREVSGETKTSSTSTLSRVWRPAFGENFPLQQASESLHEEAWVGRVNGSNLRISQDVEIKKGCVVTVSHLPTPEFTTLAPRCGSVVRSWLGWT